MTINTTTTTATTQFPSDDMSRPVGIACGTVRASPSPLGIHILRIFYTRRRPKNNHQFG